MLATLLSLLGLGRPAAFPTVTSDDIYPLHLMDSTADVLEHTPLVLMRFNDVLDADKLHAALAKLLSTGDWRKMTGRLRRNGAGELELHVPRVFTPERPAVRYSHVAFDVDICEHPLGKQLPSATPKISMQHSGNRFPEFCFEPGTAGSMADYLNGDQPPVALRITSFRDATLVAVSWSHGLSDAIGFRDMISAWCQVLASRESEVPPVLGAYKDTALEILEDEAPGREPYIWQSKILSGFGFFWFALRFVWQVLRHREVGARTLFVPAIAIAQLRKEASADLPEGSFVSDGDVLCSWLLRLAVSANQWSGAVTFLNVVDLRSRVPSVFDKAGVYLQNLSALSLTFLNASAIFRDPLGSVATAIRQSVAAQATEAQARAVYRLAIPLVKRNKRAPLISDADADLFIVTNWSKAKFIELVDFSPAVIRQGQGEFERNNPVGTMVYQLASQVKQAYMIRNMAVIIAKDRSGNYWVNLYMAEAVFGRIAEYVARYGDSS
ncbi:hypothetical protein B0I35DRAFT_411803 [Stachybotrys elegans]|uniref:Uncharacterized protein n=1 Tax=Stachybotrys elegans TaxID=80388 RepID=A0A8K0SMD4_9HYPO|nr:hypothetical protein B0I35DRAFT_411803 [Stachybotrys elegans]